MDTPKVISIVGLIIGAAGLIYAKYHALEKKKLRNTICAQAWSLYSKANNLLGATQVALEGYKNNDSTSFDPGVLEMLAKADAFSQDVFRDTIKNIHFSESKYDWSIINKWVMEGRVTEDKKALFTLLAPTEKSRIINT